MPIDYSNACIYKISCLDDSVDKLYIGSTVNLYKRQLCHKSHCYNENSNHYNYDVYKCIRNNGGWNNWTFTIIKQVQVNNKRELEAIECKYVIDYGDKCLNHRRPYRTRGEYYEENKEHLLQYKKQWWQKNKKHNAEKKKQYRINNLERLNKYYSQEVICECGDKSIVSNIARHKKTKKHFKRMKQLINKSI